MADEHPNAPSNGDQEYEPKPHQQVQGSLKSLEQSTLNIGAMPFLDHSEMRQLVATAHEFPRNLKTVVRQLTDMVMFDEAAADKCVYALPRANKPIVGPSIAFANLVATCWGNCYDASNWLTVDYKRKMVVSEGVFIDWQTNRRTRLTANRRISDKNGRLFSEDMIVVTSQAGGSIARRNAILAGVPWLIWDPIFEKAKAVIRGNQETLPQKRELAVKKLAHFGINAQKIFTYLGVQKIEEIDLEHIPVLRAIFNQLADGTVTAEDIFDPRKMSRGGYEEVDNPLGGKADADYDEQAYEDMQTAARAAKPRKPEPQQQATAQDAGATAKKPASDAAGAETGVTMSKVVNDNAQPAGAAEGTNDGKTSADTKGDEPAADGEETFPKPYIQQKAVDYIAYAKRWIAKETNGTSAKDRWAKERSIRNGMSDTIDEKEMKVLQEMVRNVGKEPTT